MKLHFVCDRCDCNQEVEAGRDGALPVLIDCFCGGLFGLQEIWERRPEVEIEVPKLGAQLGFAEEFEIFGM